MMASVSLGQRNIIQIERDCQTLMADHFVKPVQRKLPGKCFLDYREQCAEKRKKNFCTFQDLPTENNGQHCHRKSMCRFHPRCSSIPFCKTCKSVDGLIKAKRLSFGNAAILKQARLLAYNDSDKRKQSSSGALFSKRNSRTMSIDKDAEHLGRQLSAAEGDRGGFKRRRIFGKLLWSYKFPSLKLSFLGLSENSKHNGIQQFLAEPN